MLWNALLLALRAIRRNILRSSLTILGIVIGVAAVIIMVSVGRGATVQVTQQIANLGSNLLIVRPGQRLGPGLRSAAKPFDLRDVQAIIREIGSVEAAAPIASQSVTAIACNENWSTTVTGTDNQFFLARDWSVAAGRSFSDAELRAGKAVCILGATVRKELFGRQDPVGSKIRLGKLACQVIGLLASKGQTTMGTDQDDLVLVPLRTFWTANRGRANRGRRE